MNDRATNAGFQLWTFADEERRWIDVADAVTGVEGNPLTVRARISFNIAPKGNPNVGGKVSVQREERTAFSQLFCVGRTSSERLDGYDRFVFGDHEAPRMPPSLSNLRRSGNNSTASLLSLSRSFARTSATQFTDETSEAQPANSRKMMIPKTFCAFLFMAILSTITTADTAANEPVRSLREETGNHQPSPNCDVKTCLLKLGVCILPLYTTDKCVTCFGKVDASVLCPGCSVNDCCT